MIRLPTPGSDSGLWGQILNDFLTTSHNSNGTLKSDAVTSAIVADSIQKSQLNPTVQASLDNADAAVTASVPDASTTTKGKLQLAGDLAGTAANPTVPGLTSKADASTVLLKASNLSDIPTPASARTNLGLGTAATKDIPASGDASSSQLVYGTDTRLSDQRTPLDGSVTNAKLDSATQGVLTSVSSKAADSAVVHLTGTETISGSKNFTGSLAFGGNAVITSSDARLADTRVPTDSSVTNQQVAAGAAIDQTKIANLTSDLASKQALSAKGAASGYASLDSGALVPAGQLGTGTPTASTYLRGDNTWQAVPPSGESNTVSNVGSAGVGTFKQKTGINLEFKKLNATSSKITLIDDTANSKIDIDVVESSLTLGNLGGTLGVSKGGTGANTLTGVIKGSGTSALSGGATLSDLGAPTAAISFGSQRITTLADPSGAQDAATRNYVDTKTTTDAVPFSQSGSAMVGASGSWRAPVAGTITRVTVMTATAPVGSSLTVQFLKNGSVISTQSISAGTTTDATATLSVALAAGDKLAVNTTAVGSTTAATNVVAQFDYTHTT